ncbi:MAG: TRAP transporter small permease [Desulfobacteraceae bacterium]|nr:MAG: TRAP transporter small permease [Desulfobacteraceae bacterium]
MGRRLKMRFIKQIDDFLEKIEKILAVFLFSGLALLVTFNILSRHLFDYSFEKIFETAPVFVLWLALVGSSLALKKRRHIKVEFLLRYCPATFSCYSNYAVSLFGMAVTGVLFYSSLQFVSNEVQIFGNKGLFSVIFPIFFALSLFRYFTWIVYDIYKR